MEPDWRGEESGRETEGDIHINTTAALLNANLKK